MVLEVGKPEMEGLASNNNTLAMRSPNRVRRSGEQEEMGGGPELARLEGARSLRNAFIQLLDSMI